MAKKKILMVCEAFGGGVFTYVSELENTNYFVDDDNMHINLYGVIRRLKEIYNPRRIIC